MRCLSSVVAAQWDLSTCLLWPNFGSPRITSAVGDVLANFSRLSILNSLVKLFFAFSEVFLPEEARAESRSHSAEFQNIVTPENERRALGSWNYSMIAVAWVWIAGRPSGSQPRIKRLDCAPSSLYCRPGTAWTKVRSILPCNSLRIPRFSLSCKPVFLFATF
jgi:hypothetical protein